MVLSASIDMMHVPFNGTTYHPIIKQFETEINVKVHSDFEKKWQQKQQQHELSQQQSAIHLYS